MTDTGNPWHPLVLGGVAGSCGAMVVQPMIIVRTRMMVQGVSSSCIAQYGGFVNTCSTIFFKEGMRSFYRGAAVNAAFTPVGRALYMSGFELSKSTIGEGTAARDFAAGTIAQLCMSLAYVPRDIIIERCAIDGQLRSQVGSCKSSLAALRTLWKSEGARGFYRAYIPHQCVWIPYNGLFFALLGRLRAAQSSRGKQTNGFVGETANCAACAAVAGWITTPIDVIKTRIQVQGANPALFKFTGPLDCAKQIARNEGFTAFFRGSTGRIMQVAPFSAIFIPLYETLKRVCS